MTTGRPRPNNEPDSEGRPRPSSEPSTPQANSGPQSTSSSSSKKLKSNLEAYKQFRDNTSSDDCYDLVSLSNLQSLILQVAVCTKCLGPLSVFADSRLGLSVKIHIKCLFCEFEVCERNSPTVNRKRE